MTWGLNSRRGAITIGLILFLMGAAQAEDGRGQSNTPLEGAFRFSTVKTCTDVVIGSTAHFYFNGTIIYDGSGSAKLTQQGTLVLPGSTSMSFEETADLTYFLKPNGSLVQEGTFVAADRSYTITGVRMVGQIDAQGTIVMLNGPIPPEQETVTAAGGVISQYFCGASGTAIRMR
ncbi:MAG: hypothetical protein KF751_17530 [Nitrospira sp.]|nr:hypothetical protein [Nitrospira sp.]